MVEGPIPHPVLKTAVAGLIRRIVFGQVLPVRSGLEYPQDAFENAAVVLAGTATGFHTLQGRNKGCDDVPLRVGDEHGERG